MCIGVLLIAVIYFLVVILENQPNTSIILATVYNVGIALCFLISPIAYIAPSKELRSLVKNTFEVQIITASVSPSPFPSRTPEEEQKIYFEQLKQMWG
uniref:Uncharacterized protein n=1 Tax=Acrobeloides nanus TaxID=290746 RepID=A0A914DAG4_9BILA